MNELTKAFGKLKQGDYGGALKQVQQQVKKVALDMTDLEVVVEEATNLEPWGPHGKLLSRIAKEAGQSEENFREVMGVLVDRISCAWKKPKHWRMAYKSLLVLDYIIKNGPEQVVGELTDDESMDIFHDLEKFVFVGEDLRDYGINVRKRAQDIAALLNDPEALAEERSVAAKSKSKLGGMGRKGMSSSSSSSSSWQRQRRRDSGFEIEDEGAGWGRRSPTMVRTKPSFTVPDPVTVTESAEPKGMAKREEVEEQQHGGLIDLGTPEPKTESVPTPVKIEEAAAAKQKSTKQKGKAKLLSETKMNPKLRLSLKGFSAGAAPSKESAPADPATGLGDDLMSLNAGGLGGGDPFAAMQQQPAPATQQPAMMTQQQPTLPQADWMSSLSQPSQPPSQPPQPLQPLQPQGDTGLTALDPALFAPPPMMQAAAPISSSTSTASGKLGTKDPDPFKDLMKF